jgi:hypothetical protein
MSLITFKGYTVHASMDETKYQIKSDTTDHVAANFWRWPATFRWSTSWGPARGRLQRSHRA